MNQTDFHLTCPEVLQISQSLDYDDQGCGITIFYFLSMDKLMVKIHSSNQDFDILTKLAFFLFLKENICCGYSLEAPQGGASNEYMYP